MSATQTQPETVNQLYELTAEDIDAQRQAAAIRRLVDAYNRAQPTAYAASRLATRLQGCRGDLMDARRGPDGQLPNLFGDVEIERISDAIDRAWQRVYRRQKTERGLITFEAWIVVQAEAGTLAVPSVLLQVCAQNIDHTPTPAAGESAGMTAGELLDLANQLGAPVVVPGGGLYRPTLCEEA